MQEVRVAVIYYSATGTNHQMARAAQEAAEGAKAAVRLRKVAELAPDTAIDRNPAWRAHLDATHAVPVVTLDDMEWANAYIVGTPTRFGNVAAQMKQFLDTLGGLWQRGVLANRPVVAFTSASNPHGGQESTLLALYNVFYHLGCILVPPGYTDPRVFAAGGNPYGVSATAAADGVPESVLDAVRHAAERVVQVAGWLLKGQAA